MAKVEKLGNVYFNLDNVDEAARFYEDVLGLRLKFRDGNNWVAFDEGGTTLAIASHESAPSAIAEAFARVRLAQPRGGTYGTSDLDASEVTRLIDRVLPSY